MAEGVRNVVNRALHAINSSHRDDSSDEDFENILHATRSTFRPRSNAAKRGRKPSETIKKKVFLLRRNNADYFPIKSECDALSELGLGFSRGSPILTLTWSKQELEHYICSLFPNIPLDLVGFKYAKRETNNRIRELQLDDDNISVLKESLGSSMLIIIPNRDLRLPTRRNHSRNSDNDTEFRENNTGNNIPTPVQRNARRAISTHRQSQQPAQSMLLQSVEPELRRDDRPNVQNTRGTQPADNFPLINDIHGDSLQHWEDLMYEVQDQDTSFDNANLGQDDNINDAMNATENDVAEIFSITALSIDETEEITVERGMILPQLLELYDDPTLVFKKVKITFKDELGDDFGGLTREMFSIFWQKCLDMYFTGERACVPHLHLHQKMSMLGDFAKISRILNHMIMLSANIPNRIARIVYLLMGDSKFEIPPDVLLDDFLDTLTRSEKWLITKGINSFKELNSMEKDLIYDFLSTKNFSGMPKEDNFKEQILYIAENEMIKKPLDFMEMMRSGIPEPILPFWERLDVHKINLLLAVQSATPNRVVNCLKTEKEDVSAAENTTLYFLKTFIRSLDKPTLSKFLFYVTGAEYLPHEIKVSFVKMREFERAPIAHTCANLLVLSSTYMDYKDFSMEFTNILNNRKSYKFTSL